MDTGNGSPLFRWSLFSPKTDRTDACDTVCEHEQDMDTISPGAINSLHSSVRNCDSQNRSENFDSGLGDERSSMQSESNTDKTLSPPSESRNFGGSGIQLEMNTDRTDHSDPIKDSQRVIFPWTDVSQSIAEEKRNNPLGPVPVPVVTERTCGGTDTLLPTAAENCINQEDIEMLTEILTGLSDQQFISYGIANNLQADSSSIFVNSDKKEKVTPAEQSCPTVDILMELEAPSNSKSLMETDKTENDGSLGNFPPIKDVELRPNNRFTDDITDIINDLFSSESVFNSDDLYNSLVILGSHDEKDNNLSLEIKNTAKALNQMSLSRNSADEENKETSRQKASLLPRKRDLSSPATSPENRKQRRGTKDESSRVKLKPIGKTQFKKAAKKCTSVVSRSYDLRSRETPSAKESSERTGKRISTAVFDCPTHITPQIASSGDSIVNKEVKRRGRKPKENKESNSSSLVLDSRIDTVSENRRPSLKCTKKVFSSVGKTIASKTPRSTRKISTRETLENSLQAELYQKDAHLRNLYKEIRLAHDNEKDIPKERAEVIWNEVKETERQVSAWKKSSKSWTDKDGEKIDEIAALCDTVKCGLYAQNVSVDEAYSVSRNSSTQDDCFKVPGTPPSSLRVTSSKKSRKKIEDISRKTNLRRTVDSLSEKIIRTNQEIDGSFRPQLSLEAEAENMREVPLKSPRKRFVENPYLSENTSSEQMIDFSNAIEEPPELIETHIPEVMNAERQFVCKCRASLTKTVDCGTNTDTAFPNQDEVPIKVDRGTNTDLDNLGALKPLPPRFDIKSIRSAWRLGPEHYSKFTPLPSDFFTNPNAKIPESWEEDFTGWEDD